MSWPLAAAFIEWYLLFGRGLFDDLAVNHKADQVRHATWDAIVFTGLAADGPTHPLLGGLLNCGLERGTGIQAVVHVVGKVTAVAAVKEGLCRFKGLPGCVRNLGHRDWPGHFGLVPQAAKKSPIGVAR